MALRCLLFSSDEASTASIRGVLTALDVEGEPCADATVAAEKISKDSFRIVIIDWDLQPEAGLLLSAARERKASERPLTLAVVSDDQAVPKALQAGANSILRKPILISQAKDTLETARDLLRAREESASLAANAAAQASAAAAPADSLEGASTAIRPGSFLQTGAPTTLFDVESEMQKSMEESAAAEVDPLKELEPTAAAVQNTVQNAPAAPVAEAAPASDEPRGLAWYLSRSAGAAPGVEASATAPARAPIPQAKPELIGFDQTPAYVPTPDARAEETAPVPAPAAPAPREEKAEAELFAYISGAKPEEKAPREPFQFPLGKRAIGWALALAALAIIAAPQAPWHRKLRVVWVRGQQTVHGWLNPQLVTPPQAPMPHESFAQAGDEYKLPVAEAIPDATTDPSQIRVTPVVDPTAKKPNDATANADQNTAPTDGGVPTANGTSASGSAATGNAAPAADGTQPPANAVPATAPAPVPAPPATLPAPAVVPSGSSAGSGKPTAPAASVVLSPASAPSSGAGSAGAAAGPGKKTTTIVASNAAIPPSLRTQLAPVTPDPTGSKSPDGSLPSIEPVNLPEAAARGLLTEQPVPVYPESAKGQQGTVMLDLLIGQDGSVQDAKFLQGSLVFARSAINAARRWKFKPFVMNGRPVMVETKITIGFKPGA